MERASAWVDTKKALYPTEWAMEITSEGCLGTDSRAKKIHCPGNYTLDNGNYVTERVNSWVGHEKKPLSKIFQDVGAKENKVSESAMSRVRYWKRFFVPANFSKIGQGYYFSEKANTPSRMTILLSIHFVVGKGSLNAKGCGLVAHEGKGTLPHTIL